MHANTSEQVRASPKTSKNLRKLGKNREKLEKFAKISQKFSRRLVYLVVGVGIIFWAKPKKQAVLVIEKNGYDDD